MRDFQQFQAQFARAILDEDGSTLSLSQALFRDDGPTSPQRALAIYRNNIFASLTEALSEAYPVVHRLAGRDFFRSAARDYLRDRWPGERSLVVFGDGFADCLKKFPPAASLPYFGDVAAFERARLVSSHAAEAEALAPEDFLNTPQERFAEMRFSLIPSLQLLHLEWPADEIWEAHQGASVPSMEIAPASVHLALWRDGGAFRFMRLGAARWHCLEALREGGTLREAAERVLSREPDCDFQSVLGDFLRARFFSQHQQSRDSRRI